ncbi:hypothetical protein GCM10028828_20820 [Corynebacterium tapiri]
MFTPEEKRQAVIDYLNVPFGSKRQWVSQQPFTYNNIRTWRMAYLNGDLDRGLLPRHSDGMDPVRNEAMRKLEQRLKDQEQRHQHELEQLRREAQSLREANDALGKAIGLMHTFSVHKPDDTPTPNTPGDSSTPKTN